MEETHVDYVLIPQVILKIPVVPEADLEKVLRKWAGAGAAGFILEEFDDMNSQYSEALPRWRQAITNATLSPDPMLLALSSSQFSPLREEHCKHVDMTLNYEMIKLPQTYMSTDLYTVLGETHGNASMCRANFVLGMANVSPFVTRFEPQSLVEALLMFNLLSDSTPIVYYGDEYGKRDTSSESKNRNIVQMPEPKTGRMDWIDLKRVQDESRSAPNIFKVRVLVAHRSRAGIRYYTLIQWRESALSKIR